LAAIDNDGSEAQKAFARAYQEAKTAEAQQQVDVQKRPRAADFAPRYLQLAEKHPDSPEALKALVWVVNNARDRPFLQEALPRLKDKLTAVTDLGQLEQILIGLPANGLGDLAPQIAERAKQNLDDPKAVRLLLWVCRATTPAPTPELAKLYTDTIDVLVERFADHKELEALAGWLPRDDNPEWAEQKLRQLAAKNPVKERFRLALGLVLKNKDVASQSEAEKLLAAALQDFRNMDGMDLLAQQAERELDDLKVRGIGKPAPAIAGLDLDGKPFKLSDYKGKVVLLDFWGFW
jgi:hypothetical protein